MEPKQVTRKDFIVLSFTLIGGTALTAACGSDGGGPTGAAGTSGGGGSGAGGSGSAACANPLPAPQVADSTGHTHTVTVPLTALDATTIQMFTTSSTGHTHMITLTVSNLATLKSGGSVTVTSTTVNAHSHMYAVSCH